MALRGSVVGQAAMRGAEPAARASEIPLREPHQGAPKVELRQRKRRNPTVVVTTFVEELFGRGHIPAIGAKRSQRRQRGEIGATFYGVPEDREGLVVASDRLEDGGAFGVHVGGIGSEPQGVIEVTQRVGEAVERGTRAGAREEGYAVGRAIVRELFGPRFSPFVVGDATQDVPTQKQQFNELGLAPGIEPSREGLPRLAVDLRLQIAEREDTCRGG